MSQAFQIAPEPIYKAKKPVRDPAYRRFIKGFPCAACGQTWNVDPCHTGPHGISQKASDLSCIALCRKHHEEMDAAPVRFAERYQLDIGALIRGYLRLWETQYSRRRTQMGFLNESCKEPGAGATTPAPNAAQNDTPNQLNNHEDSKAVVPVRTAVGSSGAEIARFMPVMDIEQAIQRRETIVQAMQRLMQEGVDYGKIPGTDRPCLLQPGADKLCNLFGVVVKYEFEEREEDWTGERHGGEPFFRYLIRGYAHRGEFLIGEGIGECNSRESKYRWRQAERTCPTCGKDNIRKSRDRDEWYCWRKTGGCGATFDIADAQIATQQTGRKPNPDICDSVNTLVKMAFKRCKVSTTINGTSAAEFFTQDVEDFTPPAEEIDTGGFAIGSSQAAAYVAKRKIETGDPAKQVAWKSMAEMAKAFELIREQVGEVEYHAELERWGWTRFQDIRAVLDSRDAAARERAKQKVIECYSHLVAIARKEGR